MFCGSGTGVALQFCASSLVVAGREGSGVQMITDENMFCGCGTGVALQFCAFPLVVAGRGGSEVQKIIDEDLFCGGGTGALKFLVLGEWLHGWEPKRGVT